MKQKRKTLTNQRGQVSIEFIIVVGAILIIAISSFPYLQRQIELNKALTAARDGAEYAIAMRGIGYDTPTGEVSVPEGVIKIKEIRLEDTDISCPANKQKYKITFYVSAPSYIAGDLSYRSSVGTTIRNHARSYINYAFYGAYDPSLSSVETDRYCFTIGYDISS